MSLVDFRHSATGHTTYLSGDQTVLQVCFSHIRVRIKPLSAQRDHPYAHCSEQGWMDLPSVGKF